MDTATAAPDITTMHAELIGRLKVAGAQLCNAAYYLEHPDTYPTIEKTLEVAHAVAWLGVNIVDSDIREQIAALKPTL